MCQCIRSIIVLVCSCLLNDGHNIEEQGEDQEQLKVLLVAVTLRRRDYDIWLKCAYLSKKLHNTELSERCFSKGNGDRDN